MTQLGRLWQLIEARTQRGADTDAIDAEIWNRFGEEHTVMFTDLVGFSRQVAKFGIVHFLQIIHETNLLVEPIIAAHAGRIVKLEADSLLVLFPNAANAITCAVAMQRACRDASVGREPEEQLLLCIGLGHGRVLCIGDEDVFGHAVNLASRLGEDTAKSHEILATDTVKIAAGDVPGITWEEHEVDLAGDMPCWTIRYS
jgi:class 3 adenylate cyclase